MTTNKITADAVERTANWLQDHLGERYKGAAAMLRDLFTAREECERQFQEKVTEIGRLMDELAAANERAENVENDMKMALLLLEQAEPPREDEDQEWPCLVHSLASAYRGD